MLSRSEVDRILGEDSSKRSATQCEINLLEAELKKFEEAKNKTPGTLTIEEVKSVIKKLNLQDINIVYDED